MSVPASAPAGSADPGRATAGTWSTYVTPTLIAVVILFTIGVMAYVQIAVKRIESELPLRVMDEKRDMERVARNFYEFLATTDAALARPTGSATERVRDGLVTVQRDLETLRSRYTFDTLIGASALHAALSPVIDDVQIWLTEGFGAVPPSSPLVLEVVATRVRDALSKVYDKTTEADRIAYQILERQSVELRELRQRLLFVLLALGLLAITLIWIAIRQRRTARARAEAELARVSAQTRLHYALESASEGFAFFDGDERLVICNTRYREFFLSDDDNLVVPGRTFAEIARAAAQRGLIAGAAADVNGWLRERLSQFRAPQGPVAMQLTDGRWIQVSERRTEDGGTVAVYSDLTALKRHEHELVQAKEAAEAANDAKSAFLANVSHELRTPLTSILGFTQIVQRRLREVIFPGLDEPSPRARRAMDQISKNIDIVLLEGARLTTLINNVLDLEKIEAGQMTWQIQPFGLDEAITQAAAATRSLYEERGLDFNIDIAPGLAPARGDRDRVVQVIVNLISNAVKFTPRGSIYLSAHPGERGDLVVTVTDTGVGISEDDIPHVFEKFRQVGDTLTDKPSGTGLGLAICRDIVEHLGGKIWVHSVPGGGSSFSFTLPMAGTV